MTRLLRRAARYALSADHATTNLNKARLHGCAAQTYYRAAILAAGAERNELMFKAEAAAELAYQYWGAVKSECGVEQIAHRLARRFGTVAALVLAFAMSSCAAFQATPGSLRASVARDYSHCMGPRASPNERRICTEMAAEHCAAYGQASNCWADDYAVSGGGR